MINYCLLGYFRIPMWSVKISMWFVSGLMEIHRFWRSFRHAAKQNIFFSLASKNFLIILYFSIFLHKFANVNHVRNLIGWCRAWPSAERRVRPLWSSAKAEARRGWDELLMRSGLTVGTYIWWRRLLDALFLTNLLNYVTKIITRFKR